VLKKKSKSQYRSVRYRVNIHLPRTNSLHLQANPVKKDQPIDKPLHPSEQYIHTFNTFMTIQRNRKRLILSEPNEETIQGSSLFTFESMHHSVLRADVIFPLTPGHHNQHPKRTLPHRTGTNSNPSRTA
jgi:hypothetical protein